MPQASHTYAVARIRALERGLIGQDRMARMAEGSLDDVVRMLQETGYGGMPEATSDDCEAMISRELTETYRLIREISPEPELTDLFLMKADIHNLKVLLKARLLDSHEPPMLMDGGIMDPEKLRAAVANRDYRDLPELLREALNQLEKSLQLREDPQQVSVSLDKAYQRLAEEVLARHSNSFAIAYFTARADFGNVLTLLRLRAIGSGKDSLAPLLLPAGDIPHSTLSAAYDQPMESLVRMLSIGAAGSAIAEGFEEMQRTGQLSALEKARDNHLIRLIKGEKYEVMTLGPVLGYLLAREQEAGCVRLIVTAKRNRLGEQVITERLRELYG